MAEPRRETAAFATTARAVVVRGTAAAVLWWILVEGDGALWGLGTLVVGAAVAVSLRLAPPARSWPIAPLALSRFAAYFIVQSVQAGAQVALLALHPRLRLAPGWIDVRLALPAGLPRVVLMNVLSLMPGTVSVRCSGDDLRLHVLDRRLPIAAEVARTEALIAQLFTGVT
ncbi:MAG: Na+/H+ antiporter subunit E [Gammaproteobacteria bacterium]